MTISAIPFSTGLFVGQGITTVSKGKHCLADCGQCGGLHPYEFMGDCREDINRYGDANDYAQRNGVSVSEIEIVPTEDATAA